MLSVIGLGHATSPAGLASHCEGKPSACSHRLVTLHMVVNSWSSIDKQAAKLSKRWTPLADLLVQCLQAQHEEAGTAHRCL